MMKMMSWVLPMAFLLSTPALAEDEKFCSKWSMDYEECKASQAEPTEDELAKDKRAAIINETLDSVFMPELVAVAKELLKLSQDSKLDPELDDKAIKARVDKLRQRLNHYEDSMDVMSVTAFGRFTHTEAFQEGVLEYRELRKARIKEYQATVIMYDFSLNSILSSHGKKPQMDPSAQNRLGDIVFDDPGVDGTIGVVE